MSVAVAAAAPKLRLSTAALGPVTVGVGANGPAQIVDAANFADGALALSVSSSVSWLAPTVGVAHLCALRPSCLPVQIALNTAALAKGKYTGVVTVNDPNAVDAPQTITVTVQIGSAVPDSLTLYLPPNNIPVTTSFVTSSRLTASVSNPAGGPTLAVASLGGGSFDFTFTYMVSARAPAGTADAEFRGSIAVTSSSLPTDIKTVPVALRVTSQPIALTSPSSVSFRMAQNTAKQDKWIFLANGGLGALAVTGATASGGNWLSVKTSGNLVIATADASGLSAGSYQGQVSIASNAANGPISAPVTLEVVAPGRPIAFFQGVRDNALFEAEEMSQGGIVAIRGEQFTTQEPAIAPSLPLGTALGGATVYVNDRPAPIYYAAASHVVNAGGQINFQIPYDTPAGEAIVRVDRDGQRGNSISTRVVARSPRLLPLGGGYGIIVVNEADGTYAFAIPPTPGLPSRRVHEGDVLTIYALGFGQTSPPAVAGIGAPGQEPLARVPDPVRVVIGESTLPGSGVAADPVFVGLTPFLVGLYQINVYIPAGTPKGDNVPVYVTLGETFSNRVNIAVE